MLMTSRYTYIADFVVLRFSAWAESGPAVARAREGGGYLPVGKSEVGLRSCGASSCRRSTSAPTYIEMDSAPSCTLPSYHLHLPRIIHLQSQ